MSTDNERNDAPPVIHEKVLDSEVLVSDERATVRKFDQRGDEVGYSESERGGLRSATDRQPDGSYNTQLVGQPVQNEGDTLFATRIVVDALNDRGIEWKRPTEVTNLPHVDCIVESFVPGRDPMYVQVVRAISSNELYLALAKVGSHVSSTNPSELTPLLAASVQLKASRINDAATRNKIVLLLDATRLPQFSMTAVKAAVIETLPTLCAASGFRAVWIAGPTTEHTYQVWPT